MRKILCISLVWMVLLTGCTAPAAPETESTEYVHTPYVSAISAADCYVCGENPDSPLESYWGEDNVGILCLNTFQVLRLEINRYHFGELIEKPAGVLQQLGMRCDESYVHATIEPDRGYAHVQIPGQHKAIDTEAIQSHLCQGCLDEINNIYFGGYPPKSYAIVNFSDKTIRPLIRHTTFFVSDNYGINCDFEENGDMDLLIFYCPPRFSLSAE